MPVSGLIVSVHCRSAAATSSRCPTTSMPGCPRSGMPAGDVGRSVAAQHQQPDCRMRGSDRREGVAREIEDALQVARVAERAHEQELRPHRRAVAVQRDRAAVADRHRARMADQRTVLVGAHGHRVVTAQDLAFEALRRVGVVEVRGTVRIVQVQNPALAGALACGSGPRARHARPGPARAGTPARALLDGGDTSARWQCDRMRSASGSPPRGVDDPCRAAPGGPRRGRRNARGCARRTAAPRR